RRNHGNLLPIPNTRRDIGGDPRQPVAPHTAIGIDKQRRSDLDDQALAGGGREKGHGRAVVEKREDWQAQSCPFGSALSSQIGDHSIASSPSSSSATLPFSG